MPSGPCFWVETNPIHIEELKKKLARSHNYTIIPKRIVPDGNKLEKISFKVSEKYNSCGGIKDSHTWELIDPSIVPNDVRRDYEIFAQMEKSVNANNLLARIYSCNACFAMEIILANKQ